MKNRLVAVAVFLFAVTCITANAVTIKGRVVDAETGKPVEGVDVICEHHENRNSDDPDDFQLKTKTGKDGAFVLKPAKGEEQFMVLIQDKDGNIIDGRTHVDEDVDFGTVKAGGGFELMGMVFDSKGDALPNAQVKARFRFPKSSCSHYIDLKEIKTESDGSFVFGSLPEAKYAIGVIADKHAPGHVAIEVCDDLNYTEIRLELGASVKGTITDKDGKPLAGVKVAARRSNSTTSAEDGSYELKGLGGGRNYLTITSEDYVLPSGDSLTLSCTKGETTTKDLKLVAAGKLKVLLKPENEAVKIPASLNASLSPKKRTRSYSYTSRRASVKGGVATFTRLPEGEFEVRLSGQGMADAKCDAKIEAGETTTTNLVLKQVFKVSGKITGPDGEPVESANLSLGGFYTEEQQNDPDFWQNMDRVSEYSETGEDGSYELEDVPEGKYEIKISASGLLPTNVIVEVGRDKKLTRNVKLERGLSIKGSVFNADGSPVEGIELSSDGPKEDRSLRSWSYSSSDDEFVSGKDGAFEITGLAGGSYELTASDKNGEEIASVKNVAAGAEDVIIMLAQIHKVKVEVRNEAGKPVDGAVILSQKLSGDGMEYDYRSIRGYDEEDEIKTDAGGRATIELREGNNYQLSAKKRGLLAGHKRVDMRADKVSKQGAVKIVLKKGADVQVTVLGPDGKPVKGADVNIQSADMYYGIPSSMDDEEDAVTDAEGKHTMKNVSPGVVTIVVSRSDEDGRQSTLATKRVQIKAGAANSVTMKIAALGKIRGAVVDKDGKPVTDGTVYMYNPRNPTSSYNVETDEKGAFEIEDVAPGEYTISCMIMSAVESGERTRPMTDTVTVKKGETAEVKLSPPKASAKAVTISGKITSGGKPAGPGEIYFMPKPKKGKDAAAQLAMYSQTGESEVDENGAFSLEAIDPGEYIYRYQPSTKGDSEEDMMQSYYSGSAGTLKIDKASDSVEIKVPVLKMKIKLIGDGGVGLADAQVSVLPELGDLMTGQMFMKIAKPEDRDGDYTVHGMEPGSYTVYVRAEGSTAVRKGVKFEKGSAPLKIVMGEGHELSGKVTLADGGTATGAGVVVFDMKAQTPSDFANVGVDGSFKARCRLQPGEYAVFAVKEGYTVDGRKISVTKDAELNFNLKPAGDVNVTLKGKDAEGRKLTLTDQAGKEVFRIKEADMDYGYGPWGSPSIKKTDTEGKTSVKGLAPGKYTVEVDGTGKKASVSVKALETAEITISL